MLFKVNASLVVDLIQNVQLLHHLVAS